MLRTSYSRNPTKRRSERKADQNFKNVFRIPLPREAPRLPPRRFPKLPPMDFPISLPTSRPIVPAAEDATLLTVDFVLFRAAASSFSFCLRAAASSFYFCLRAAASSFSFCLRAAASSFSLCFWAAASSAARAAASASSADLRWRNS